MLAGTGKERADQAERISHVTVQPVARVSLTRHMVEQCIETLQRNLEAYDKARDAEEA